MMAAVKRGSRKERGAPAVKQGRGAEDQEGQRQNQDFEEQQRPETAGLVEQIIKNLR